MVDFCLSCCSMVDLTLEWREKKKLRYVCFKYMLGGVEKYISHFEAILKDGLDILRVTLPTGLAGTCDSACISEIVEQMTLHAEPGRGCDGKCFMCHSLCLKDAQAAASMVEELFPRLRGKMEIFPIGTATGSHTGPGTAAFFFWGSPRMS